MDRTEPQSGPESALACFPGLYAIPNPRTLGIASPSLANEGKFMDGSRVEVPSHLRSMRKSRFGEIFQQLFQRFFTGQERLPLFYPRVRVHAAMPLATFVVPCHL
jgi:hypothetical protein